MIRYMGEWFCIGHSKFSVTFLNSESAVLFLLDFAYDAEACSFLSMYISLYFLFMCCPF